VISTILSIVGGLLQLANKFMSWFRDEKLVETGRDLERGAAAVERLKAETEANAVRNAVRANLARDSKRRMQDDEFTRDD